MAFMKSAVVKINDITNSYLHSIGANVTTLERSILRPSARCFVTFRHTEKYHQSYARKSEYLWLRILTVYQLTIFEFNHFGEGLLKVAENPTVHGIGERRLGHSGTIDKM